MQDLQQMLSNGLSQRVIAKELGISQTALRFRMKKLGLVSATRKAMCKPCKFCGVVIPGSQAENRYCSIGCAAEAVKNQSKVRFFDGLCANRVVHKRCLIELHGEKCTLCGQGPLWNNKQLTLQVDHIDGNSDNNHPDNLRLLCPNCHTQTETFGSKGSGNRYKKISKRNKYLQEYKAGWSER